MMNPRESNPQIGADDELLKKAELAKRCGGVSTRTIVDWQAQGLPHIRISSRLNLYRWGSVREWLRKHEVRTIRPGGAA